jgi:methanogenic corrinoid protein MtbC1
MNPADVRMRLDELAQEITRRHMEQRPDVFARYPEIGKQRCFEDARFHLRYLAAAVEAESPAMFADYVGWAKIMLASRNIPPDDLADNLAILADVVGGGILAGSTAVAYVREAIAALPSMPDDVPSFLDDGVAREYLRHLLAGSRRDAAAIVTNALDGGMSARDVYRRIFEPAQHEIGRLWQLNRISVAQEHFCTAATQHIMTQLYGRIFEGERRDRRAVAMCVGGELHEIGLRIVSDLLELDGWETFYLGASVPPASAVKMCVERRAHVLLVSATLPPHLDTVAEVVRLFRGDAALADAKIVVGGGAFRTGPGLWRTLGADGYAVNADDCIELLGRLVA